MAAACNEHFGSMARAIAAGSDEGVIKIPNETEYGLAVSVQCADEDRARWLADRVESGVVHINDHPIQEEPNAPLDEGRQPGSGRYNGEWVRHEFPEETWTSVQHETREYGPLTGTVFNDRSASERQWTAGSPLRDRVGPLRVTRKRDRPFWIPHD